MIVYRDASGAVINIGEWQHVWEPRTVIAEGGEVLGRRVIVGADGKDVLGEDGEPQLCDVLAQAGQAYVPDPTDLIDLNPVPEGATWAEEDIAARADGGLAAADDYASLRRAAYPSIRDQLDALGKGGAAWTDMAAQLAAVKATYPKPEQQP